MNVVRVCLLHMYDSGVYIYTFMTINHGYAWILYESQLLRIFVAGDVTNAQYWNISCGVNSCCPTTSQYVLAFSAWQICPNSLNISVTWTGLRDKLHRYGYCLPCVNTNEDGYSANTKIHFSCPIYDVSAIKLSLRKSVTL